MTRTASAALHACAALALAMLPAFACAAPPQAGEMRVSVSASNGEPFVLYRPEQGFAGGLARDIVDHLASELRMQPVYLDLPRSRVESWLRRGEVDAACFLAPAWVAQPDALRWSPMLFHIRQVIVRLPDTAPVTAPDGLFGHRLGTLNGYRYPELETYFKDGRIQRADAPSVASNFGKLLRGRVDAYVDVDISALYHVQQSPVQVDVRLDPLWAPPNPVHCAFNAAFYARHADIDAILQRAVDEGRVERWISVYTGGRQIGQAGDGE